MDAAEIMVMGFSSGALLLGWSLSGAVQLDRPALGVFSLADIVVTLGAVVLMPLLYVVAPTWLVSGMLLLAATSSIHTMFTSLFGSNKLCWSIVGGTLAADVVCAVWLGPHHLAFALVNNTVLVCVAGTVATLWVQSGLRASHVAVLTLALSAYDVLATGLLHLTDNLLAHLSGALMASAVSWGSVSVGLGDLLIATTVPVVYRKAFSTAAGMIALFSALVGIGLALLFQVSGPLIAGIGPILVLEYMLCRHRYGPERTVREYTASINEPAPRDCFRTSSAKRAIPV